VDQVRWRRSSWRRQPSDGVGDERRRRSWLGLESLGVGPSRGWHRENENRLASRGRGSFQPEKGFSLDKCLSKDGLPNTQIDKTKENIQVSFIPREKAEKLVGFWAAKPALTVETPTVHSICGREETSPTYGTSFNLARNLFTLFLCDINNTF
jgi:hypothetical protein